MFLRKEGHEVENAVIVILRKYSSGDIVGGISFDEDFSVQVEVMENRCSRECCFQTSKGFVTLKRSVEGDVFSCEVYKRCDQIRVSFNKMTVKVYKA